MYIYLLLYVLWLLVIDYIEYIFHPFTYNFVSLSLKLKLVHSLNFYFANFYPTIWELKLFTFNIILELLIKYDLCGILPFVLYISYVFWFLCFFRYCFLCGNECVRQNNSPSKIYTFYFPAILDFQAKY